MTWGDSKYLIQEQYEMQSTSPQSHVTIQKSKITILNFNILNVLCIIHNISRALLNNQPLLLPQWFQRYQNVLNWKMSLLGMFIFPIIYLFLRVWDTKAGLKVLAAYCKQNIWFLKFCVVPWFWAVLTASFSFFCCFIHTPGESRTP